MNDFLIGLLSNTVSYTNSNIYKVDFGKNSFVIKMVIRLVLRKAQVAIDTKSFGNFDWKQVLKDLGSITK